MYLENEVDIVESIYSMLRQEYEMVKIEEADNAKTFQIIQYPEIPKNPYFPKRKDIIVVFIITVFCASILLSFVIEYFINMKKDPEESKKFERIKALLKISS
ncbi:unnamed protein product [marine sediment metagenome]|uniref:Tyrosine kinase G-rich domain-containing protein n=1 Tax=marine sediment metagenome TaxID=412755 RepID=X0YUB8_9ZZZZ